MKFYAYSIVCVVVLCTSFSHGQLPTPAETFGFEVGADYKLASYDQMLAYYATLDAASNRVKVTEIGHSVDGRPISD